MSEEQERIIIPDENGEEHLFDVVFSFDVDATETSYIVVTPSEQGEDDEGDVEVFAFRYEENGDDPEDFALFPIETDEEWEMVEEMINTYTNEQDL
ncbi:DUF1292 domain-containing protein [Aureibacillus halotolerans]|uniref:UPF0473 protein EV213_11194 n=1 Tax=Aureibacillus halotolerans TaxID=1508390 RepID=A0A4R6U037_9BACI|nr:DUF1292 domain-containing protein [Aureibacillus halotolerans]TDQ38013.1 uncharacterized protein YrzB (UPF0473 family) [Aureibacillus halotolerans]